MECNVSFLARDYQLYQVYGPDRTLKARDDYSDLHNVTPNENNNSSKQNTIIYILRYSKIL